MKFNQTLSLLLSIFLLGLLITSCEKDEPEPDPVSISFNSSTGTIAENSATPFTVTITSSVAAPGAGSATVSITGGTYGTDFTTSEGSASFTVNIASGATFGTFTLQPVDNSVVDGDKTLQVSLSGATGFVTIGSPSSLSLTIQDDDMAPPPDDVVSLSDLRAMYNGTDDVTISDEMKIEGVVISTNDATNNQNIIIQNGTDGMLVRFDDAHTVVRGQNVEIQLQGGTISDFNNLVQVTGVAVAALTDNGAGTLPTPQTITIAQLNTGDYESELVTIAGGTFGAANGSATVNGNNDFTVGAETTTVRVSGPDWSSNVLPRGMGDITGIAGVFGDAEQVLPQIPEDFFADTDPGGGGGGGATTATIGEIRAMYSGSDVSINSETSITGIVISTNDATNNQNVVIQNGTDGILVRFNDPHSFVRGNELTINLNGGTISDFNALVQVTGVDLAAATDNGASTLPDAQVVTITELNTGNYESELVTIQGGMFPAANGSDKTVNGNNDFTIGGETTTVRVSGPDWSTNLLPLGMGDVSGIAGIFGTGIQVLPQLPEDFFASMESGMLMVTASLTDFGTVNTGESSASQSFTVASQMATADIDVSATAPFEVSLDDVTFASSVVIPFATSNAGATNVYVRYSPISGVSAAKTGTITIMTSGIPTETISLAGTENGTSTLIAGTSFEEGTVVSRYTDTGDAAVDHDLVNNDGQSHVDFTATATELGLDAVYTATRTDGVGLTDGDDVGFTDFADNVGSFTDGTQGYTMSDCDGKMTVFVDTVDISGHSNVSVNLDLFVQSTGWESDDAIRIYIVDGDTGVETDLINTTGMDIDDNFAQFEGVWTTLSQAVTGNFIAVVIELDSNSGSENIYVDKLQILGN